MDWWMTVHLVRLLRNAGASAVRGLVHFRGIYRFVLSLHWACPAACPERHERLHEVGKDIQRHRAAAPRDGIRDRTMTEASPLHWPLQWPIGRPRLQHGKPSRFKIDFLPAVQMLRAEIRRLGAEHLVISTNIELRPDGLPYANRREPEDEGVAVYFTYRKQPMCFACDMWDKVGDNIYAIARTIKALRGIDRWGAGEMFKQAFTAFAAPPVPKSPHEILGVRPDATQQEIDVAYRRKAKLFHPDAPGGSESAMVELNKARDALKAWAA
jgi:hypothetical protein